MANEIATAYVRIMPTAEGIQNNLQSILGKEGTKAGTEAGGNFASTFGSSVSQVAQTISPVTNAAKNAITDIISTTSQFDASMSNVQAITGANTKEFETLRDTAIDMGKQTKFSASEVADAMSYMGMAGWKTNDIVSGTPGILNLAAAAGADLASTSDIVTDALTAFGKTAGDANEMANVMASTATNSNTNVHLMGETFKYVAPLCGAMGFSMQDAALAAGLMGNAGIKGSQAGTSMKNVITRLIKPTEDSAAAMEKLGIKIDDGHGNMLSMRDILGQVRTSMGDLKVDTEAYEEGLSELNKELESGNMTEEDYTKSVEELAAATLKSTDAQKGALAAQLAGAYGLSGLLAIVNASDEDFEKLASAIDNSSEVMVKCTDGSIMPMAQAMEEGKEWTEEFNGSAEAMSSIMQDNLAGSMKTLESRMEAIKISLGDKIMPLLENGADWIIKFLDWFSGLDDGVQTMIVGAVGLTAVSGPLLNTIGLVSKGFGGIASIGSKLIGGVPSMTEGISTLMSGGSNLIGSLGAVKTAALLAADALILAYDYKALKDATEGYKEAAQAHEHEIDTALSNYVKLYNEKGKDIADEWAQTVYQIDTTGMDMDTAQKALTEKVNGYWDDVPQNMWDGFKAGWNDYFGSGGKGIIQLGKDAFFGLVGGVKSLLGINSPSTVFKGIGENLIAGLSQGMSSSKLSSAFDRVLKAFGNFKTSFGKIDLSTLGHNLIVGLTNGINKAAHDAVQAAINVGSSIINAAKRVFGVASPSKVFFGIGNYLTEGLANGITGNSAVALRAMMGLGDEMIESFSPYYRIGPTRYSGPARNNANDQVHTIQAAGSVGKNLTVILELDRMQLGRAVYQLNNEETQRVGVRLAGGYA